MAVPPRFSPSPGAHHGPWLSAHATSPSPFPLSQEDEATLLRPLNLGTDEEEEVWNGDAVGFGFGFAHAQWSSFSGKSQRPSKTCPVDELDFTCNICFETASDPCVTRCGHIFCLRDLRSWLKSIQPRSCCPVCKANCVLDRDVVLIFDRAGKRPVYQPATHSPAPPSTSSSCPTPTWRPAYLHYLTQPSTPLVPKTPSNTSTDWTPRPSISVPDIRINNEPAIPRRRSLQLERPIVLPPHPLEAQQVIMQQFSRVLSIVALTIVLTILLK